MWSECASDQTPTGYDIEVEVEKGVISTANEIGEGGLKAHRSQNWRSWRCHENLQGGAHSVH